MMGVQIRVWTNEVAGFGELASGSQVGVTSVPVKDWRIIDTAAVYIIVS
jgi:hypothetical protein